MCDIVCVCVIHGARFPLHCPYQFARLRKRFIYAWLYGWHPRPHSARIDQVAWLLYVYGHSPPVTPAWRWIGMDRTAVVSCCQSLRSPLNSGGGRLPGSCCRPKLPPLALVVPALRTCKATVDLTAGIIGDGSNAAALPPAVVPPPLQLPAADASRTHARSPDRVCCFGATTAAAAALAA